MEVWRLVILEVHADHDAEESGDLRHRSGAGGCCTQRAQARFSRGNQLHAIGCKTARTTEGPGRSHSIGHGSFASLRMTHTAAGPLTISEHTAIRRVDSHSALEAALGSRERVRGRRAGGIGCRIGGAGPRVSCGLALAARIAPIAPVAASPAGLVLPTDDALDPSERLTSSPAHDQSRQSPGTRGMIHDPPPPSGGVGASRDPSDRSRRRRCPASRRRSRASASTSRWSETRCRARRLRTRSCRTWHAVRIASCRPAAGREVAPDPSY